LKQPRSCYNPFTNLEMEEAVPNFRVLRLGLRGRA
jgi:hypothetical protein